MQERPEHRSVPAAVALGYAGLIPFVGISALLWLGPASMLQQGSVALLSYAAVIASFLGAVHFGLAITAGGAVRNDQMALSVVPALIAWFALLLPASWASLAFALLFTALCWFDVRAARRGLAPAWYPKLRLPLSAVVVLSLLSAAGALVVKG